jgi:hypothetical protein
MTRERLKRFFLRLTQYRLRTLLIATTLLCLWLGWKVHQADRQRRAVAAIQVAAGWVKYDYESEDYHERSVTKWLRESLGPDYVHSVVSVGLREGTSLLDGQMIHRRVTRDALDTVLRELPNLPKLQAAHFFMAPVEDDHLQAMSQLSRLETLEILFGRISDAGLRHLERLTNLRHLDLDYTPITQAGIDRLQRALPQCHIEW